MGKWKKLSSKIGYQTPYLKVDEDQVIKPDGTRGIYSIVRRPVCCITIAIDNQKRICLIKQFRYAIQKESWELPMGGNDNQDLLVAAKRELQEETGLTAREWKRIGDFYLSNGHSDACAVVFIAQQLTQTEENEQAEEGITDCDWFKLVRIKQMIIDGELDDGPTLTSLYLAELKGIIG